MLGVWQYNVYRLAYYWQYNRDQQLCVDVGSEVVNVSAAMGANLAMTGEDAATVACFIVSRVYDCESAAAKPATHAKNLSFALPSWCPAESMSAEEIGRTSQVIRLT